MRLFAFFGSLLVLALLAALIVPPYVDWNQFKGRFEQEAEKALGLPVKVLGQTSARLLPLPSVTFTKLEIGGADGQDPILTAESFRLDVELAPLLKGDVVIVDMQLSYPVAQMRLDQEGRLVLPELTPQRDELQNADVAVENITIDNGVFQFEDSRSGRRFMVQDIDLRASARDLRGPWRVRGLGTHKDERVRVEASTGLWQPTDQMRVTLDIEPLSQPYDFEFEGPLKLKEGVPSLEGVLTVSPMARQSDEDLITFRRPDRETALPIRLESNLQIASGGATVPGFKLEIGPRSDPYSLTGNGQAVFGNDVSFRIRAEGQQINVERLDQAGGKIAGSGKGLGFAERMDALRALFSKVPQFRADGEINLYLPAFVAGDTVIREVGMDLRPAENGDGWQIANLEAQLPGRTDLRADGKLILGDNLGYEGELIVASRQPSGLAKWLGTEITPTLRDLTSAGFSATSTISSDLVLFKDAEIILDGKSLKGEIKREAKEGEIPVLVAKMRGESVNLDQLNGLYSMFSGVGANSMVSEHNLDIDLEAEAVTLANVSAEDVRAKLELTPVQVDIQELEIGNLQDASVSITGSLENKRASENIWDLEGGLQANLVASDPSRFLSLLNNRLGPFPVIPRLIKNPDAVSNTDLKLDFRAVQSGYQFEIDGQSGKSAVSLSVFSPQIMKQMKQQRLKITFVIDNPETAQLLYQMGVPVVPVDNSGRGAFRLSGEGTIADGFGGEAALTLRNGFISGGGKLKIAGEDKKYEPSGAFDITGEIMDADTFILLSGLPIPGFGEGYQAKFSANMLLEDGLYTVQNLQGAATGSKFSGSLTFNQKAKPRPKVGGELMFDTFALEAIAGLVYVGGEPVAGDDPIQPVMSGLDGQIVLKTQKASLKEGWPEVSDLTTTLSVRDGDIGFDDINGTWIGGRLDGSAALAHSNRDWSLNGQMSLQDADVSSASKLVGLVNGLTGNLNTSGTFQTAGKDITSMVSRLTASGTIGLTSAGVTGLDNTFFKRVLRDADTIKDEEVASATDNLIAKNLDGALFTFADVDVPFTVASGRLRINNLVLEDDAMAIRGTVRHDFETQNSVFEGNVEFDAGREVVVGTSPEFDLNLTIANGEVKRTIDSSLFATYLGMRIGERREREFDSQRAAILERQRLLQTVRIYALKAEAKRIAEEERERIRQLELEKEERRKREEARRRREELERKRLEAQLEEAERAAAREAAAEAGRRERRQKQIELLRKQSEEAAKRLQLDLEVIE